MEAQKFTLELFWKFIQRRQLAWYRKEVLKKPPPWSKDPVIQTTWFTNMYRELDPGTTWCVDNILSNPHLKQADKAFWSLFYRFAGSNRKAMEHVEMVPAKEYSIGHVHLALRELHAPFGAAYTVYPFTNVPMGMAKVELVARGFGDISEVWPDLWPMIKKAPEAESAYKLIRTARIGVGPFTGYQALVDYMMPNAGGKQLVPFSRDSWAMAGPGALLGLQHIFGKKHNPKQALEAMRWLHDQQHVHLDYDKPYWLDHALYLSDIQNCLCEYSKYLRVRSTGRITRKYAKGR